jgi:hypothetical protein
MADFFASGRAVDVVLLVLLLEALILRRRGRAGMLDIIGALGPAVLILIGLRAALTGAPWPMIALPLALSFPLHLFDLRRRRW